MYNRGIASATYFVMAKKLKKQEVEIDEPLMRDDVRQSVLAIVVAAIGAVLALSFFGFAGGVGVWIDGYLALLLGIARIVVPVIFFLLAADVVLRDKQLITLRGIGSFFLLLLSLNGMLNMLFAHGVTSGDALKNAGGLVGLLVSQYLVSAMGSLAAFIIALAILLVSCVLLFNASISSLVDVPMTLFGGMKRKQNADGESEDEDLPFDERKKLEEEQESESESESEPEDGDEDEDVVEDEDAEAVGKKKPMIFTGNQEHVMTSKARRTIEIPLELLELKSSEAKSGDLERGTELIVKTLHQFGIDVEVEEVRVGPTITQYALKPPAGIKLARIVALQNDLALALAAHPIRIEAPIPGKSLVGIEVPNQTIGRVCLRELWNRRSSNIESRALVCHLERILPEPRR